MMGSLAVRVFEDSSGLCSYRALAAENQPAGPSRLRCKRNVDSSSVIQEQEAGLQNVGSIDLEQGRMVMTDNDEHARAGYGKTRRTLCSTSLLAMNREGHSRIHSLCFISAKRSDDKKTGDVQLVGSGNEWGEKAKNEHAGDLERCARL